jgi:hypothetical protein
MANLYNYLVTTSTSLINLNVGEIYSRQSTPVILLSTLFSPGVIITVRDVGGDCTDSKPIVISTTRECQWRTPPTGPRTDAYIIEQPFGFATVTARNSTVWGVINTFGFPYEGAVFNVNAMNVVGLYVSTLDANYIANFSTALVSSLSVTTGFVEKNFSVGMSTLMMNSYVKNSLLVNSTLSTIGQVTFASTVVAQGPLFLSNYISSTSYISTGADLASWNAYFVSSISVGGNVSVGGSIALAGAMALNNLTVLNSISCGTTLTVGNTAAIMNSISAGTSLTVGTTIKSLQTISTGGDLEAVDIYNKGFLRVLNNVSVGGVIGATTVSTLASISVGTFLWVGGQISTGSNLAVYNNLNINSSISSIGHISTGANLAAWNAYVVSSISTGGNVSIGGQLYVAGNMTVAGSAFDSLSVAKMASVGQMLHASTISTNLVNIINPTAANHVELYMSNVAGTKGSKLALQGTTGPATGTAAGDLLLRTEATTQKFVFQTGTNNSNLVVSNATVGINQTTPVETLHVNGTGLFSNSGANYVKIDGSTASQQYVNLQNAGTTAWQIGRAVGANSGTTGFFFLYSPNAGGNVFEAYHNGNAVIPNNCGIGTNSPTGARLHLHNATAGSAVSIRLTDGTTTTSLSRGFIISKDAAQGANIWNYEPAAMYFGTNNTNRMTILDGGNVGIGTSIPTSKLEVTGGSVNFVNGNTRIRFGSVFPKDGPTFLWNTIAAGEGYTEICGAAGSTGNGGFRFYGGIVNDSYPLPIDHIMTMNGSSKYVGIGTTNPQSKLHLHEIGYGVNVQLQLTDETTGSASTDGFIIKKDTNQHVTMYNMEPSATLSLGTNNQNRITILGNGFVGINYGNPQDALQVGGGVTATAFTGNGSGLTGVNAATATTATTATTANALNTANSYTVNNLTVNGTLNASITVSFPVTFL